MKFIHKLKDMSACEKAVICLVLFYLPFHILLSPGYWDDAAFSRMIQEHDYNYIQFTMDRYHSWSSRITIELVGSILTILPGVIWKMIDLLMIILLFFDLKWLFIHIFQCELKELDYILALSLCAYPFSTMAQTGWIATTTNYLWVVSLGLFVINQMLKVGILDEKISFIKLMLTYMAALYCASYETITIFLLAISLGTLIYRQKKYKKNSSVAMGCLLIAGLMLIYILACPGNQLRTVSDTKTWMPEYNILSLGDKIRIGILSSFMHFVSIPSPIFFVLNLVILLAGKNKKLCDKLILSVPLALDILWTGYYLLNYALGYKTFTYQTPVAIPTALRDRVEQIMLLVTVLIWFGIVFYTLIRNFNQKTSIYSICFLISSCIPELVVGLTPTIFASILRTTIYLYMAMIILIICIVYECDILKNLRNKYLLYVGLMGGCLLNALQIIRHIRLYG